MSGLSKFLNFSILFLFFISSSSLTKNLKNTSLNKKQDENCFTDASMPFDCHHMIADINFDRDGQGKTTLSFSIDEDNTLPVARIEITGNAEVTVYSSDDTKICSFQEDLGSSTYSWDIVLMSNVNAIKFYLGYNNCKDDSLDIDDVRFLTVTSESNICNFSYSMDPVVTQLMLSKTAR
jgi:FlaG/FlaF family flagellin (archaellin)